MKRSSVLLFVVFWLFGFCAVSDGLVGILYEGWHGPAALAMSLIQQMGGTQLTVEQVIQSNGNYLLYDIIDRYNMSQLAWNFYYNVKPIDGFYCIYRKRPNETGLIPDCPNIEATLKRHAKQLLDAMVDYVVADSTNLCDFSAGTDLIQVRPTQVLFEEWLKFNQRGIPTPKIAVWQCIPKGSDAWTIYMSTLYNNQSYENLILKDPSSGKKIFFIVDPPDPPRFPDPAIIQQIESNGGKNDVIVIHMWAEYDPSRYSQGLWGFFSPCTVNGQYTSSIINTECDQYSTTGSKMGGVEISASPSYQLNFGSLPFGAPGKFRGLTMKKQFQTIFERRPQHIFISSWNEFISQPQANPYTNINTGFSMGLPQDPYRSFLWVDTYGAEFSRDIEPTVEYGSYYYELMKSCLRVYKSGATRCSNMSEECCNLANSAVYTNIYSLRKKDQTDYLLTNSAYEATVLIESGLWEEVCSPFIGPTDFCVNPSLLQGQSASFIVFSTKINADDLPLYRCETTASTHFFSLYVNCEGYKLEGQLGFISRTRSGNSIRALYRCYQKQTGVHYHSLDLPCPAADQDAGLLGYVR